MTERFIDQVRTAAIQGNKEAEERRIRNQQRELKRREAIRKTVKELVADHLNEFSEMQYAYANVLAEMFRNDGLNAVSNTGLEDHPDYGSVDTCDVDVTW